MARTVSAQYTLADDDTYAAAECASYLAPYKRSKSSFAIARVAVIVPAGAYGEFYYARLKVP